MQNRDETFFTAMHNRTAMQITNCVATDTHKDFGY